jgi:NAD(P)-dependent dehydrogenase (short-subunit alcohol dehydrogenase family)
LREDIIVGRVADIEVLVTGANRGISWALVEEALSRGAKPVYAGTRNGCMHSDARVVPVLLDMTDARHIAKAAWHREPHKQTGTPSVDVPAS